MLLMLKAGNLDGAGAAHAFFGRPGGVSTGVYESLNCGPGSRDSRDAVIENRRRAMMALSPGGTLVTLYQVHGAEVITVSEPWEIGSNPRADAMVTNRPGVALGILTADCAPILLWDPKAGVAGAAHAGWQGALLGVTDSVVAAMVRLGAKPSDIRAAVGPSIGPAAYEVSAEFEARFLAADSGNSRFFTRSSEHVRPHFDLPGYVVRRLKQASLGAVEALNRCTYEEDDDFFSYRRCTHRKEPDYGRQLSAILLPG